MRIDGLLGKGRPTLSVEFYPPRTEDGASRLRTTLQAVRQLKPSFCSVTCGAGGSMVAGDAGSIMWAQTLRDEYGLEPLIHLTCFGRTLEEMTEKVGQVKAAGLQNILALRGDLPDGFDPDSLDPGACRFAIDLIRILKDQYPEACLCGGAYPEGHQDAASHQADLMRLKEKVDAGLDFLITQLFFVNESFYRFRDECREIGIQVPIIAGILPLTSASQLKHFVKMTGAEVPAGLRGAISAATRESQAAEIGTEYAIEQCRDLIENGVDGLHIYALNRSKAVARIAQALNLS